MNGFTPSAAQARAIAEIRDWYLNHRHIQQIFRLFGYAGSGKSTITRYAIEALGLEIGSPEASKPAKARARARFARISMPIPSPSC